MIRLIVGRIGTGKTCLIRSLIPYPMPAKTLIADPRGNFKDFARAGALAFPLLTVQMLEVKNALIVIDELKTQLADGDLMTELKKHLAFSRQDGQDYILGTHRPVGITVEAFGLADWLYVFRTTAKRDLDQYSVLPGMDGRWLDRIRNLPKFHHVKIPLG